MNGKIKVESGQIYQNPVSWIKDLVGGDSYVTWNYVWSKVSQSSPFSLPPFFPPVYFIIILKFNYLFK